jgi:flavin reductase (DIM6/NTAB) family NADH-FMN oxidoreductase RutF
MHPSGFAPGRAEEGLVDPEHRRLRDCLGQFASGVTVVTTKIGAAVHGTTVSSFSSVSLDPPLVLVSVDRRSRACERLAGAPFGVNVLGADQSDLALFFAGLGDAAAPPDFAWDGDAAAPRLAGALAHLSCVPWASYDGGDHVLYVGEVVAFAVHGGEPLVYHSGTFGEFHRPSGGSAWTGSLDGPAYGWPTDLGTLANAGGL